MRTFFVLNILFLSLSLSMLGQTTKHVLFLGNSYTAVNNLPQIVASLAQNMGDSLVYNQNLPGGFTLQGHSTNSTSLSFIQQGTWDYVVLQEQSQKPSWPITQVITEVFPYAKILCDSIRNANPCATPLFYMTWGRKNGDASNCPNWPPVCTYEGMDSLLNLRYCMMADSNDAYVSPVGAVWRYIRNNNSINLYAADESHPSLAGSYAAACTFYSLIFQKNPVLITENYGLDKDVAMDIRSAAKIIAFDSLSKWNVGKYIPEANFTSNQVFDSIIFTNKSVYANTYHWNFGDGNTSTLFEPHHKYLTGGNYHVYLEVSKCNQIDTTSLDIQVLPTLIKKIKHINVEVFPNPIENEINIKTDKAYQISNINIISIEGKLIESFDSIEGKSIKLRTQKLSSGIYILNFEIEGKTHHYRIIKK